MPGPDLTDVNLHRIEINTKRRAGVAAAWHYRDLDEPERSEQIRETLDVLGILDVLRAEPRPSPQ